MNKLAMRVGNGGASDMPVWSRLTGLRPTPASSSHSSHRCVIVHMEGAIDAARRAAGAWASRSTLANSSTSGQYVYS